MSGSKSSGRPGSTTLTPTIPTPLALLYRATSEARLAAGLSPLPTISTLLREAMVATLVSLGVDPAHPAFLPPPTSRTSRATQAATSPEARAARAQGNAATYHGDLERRQEQQAREEGEGARGKAREGRMRRKERLRSSQPKASAPDGTGVALEATLPRAGF